MPLNRLRVLVDGSPISTEARNFCTPSTHAHSEGGVRVVGLQGTGTVYTGVRNATPISGRCVSVLNTGASSFRTLLSASTQDRPPGEWRPAARLLCLFDDYPVALGIGWPHILSELSDLGRTAGLPNELMAAVRLAGSVLASAGVMWLPELGDASDGDVTMYWKSPTFAASLSFERGGTVTGYAYSEGDLAPWELDESTFDEERLIPLVQKLLAS